MFSEKNFLSCVEPHPWHSSIPLLALSSLFPRISFISSTPSPKTPCNRNQATIFCKWSLGYSFYHSKWGWQKRYLNLGIGPNYMPSPSNFLTSKRKGRFTEQFRTVLGAYSVGFLNWYQFIHLLVGLQDASLWFRKSDSIFLKNFKSLRLLDSH